MEQKRQTILLVILCIVTVCATVFLNSKTNVTGYLAANTYAFTDVFQGGVLMYRPEGTTGLALFDLSDAIIVVTEQGAPENCVSIEIYSNAGNITTPCATGILSE